MKFKALLVFFLTLTASIGFAQGPQCDDPDVPEGDLKVFSPDIEPNPLDPVSEEGQGDFIFIVSNDNGSYDSGDAQLTIQLTDVIAPKGVADLSSVSIPAGDYWSWSYDAGDRTFTGTQIAPIPSDYAEQITIGIQVTANSTQENKTNGFEVDISFPNALACNASTSNDHVDRRTYTRLLPIFPIHILDFRADEKGREKVNVSWKVEDTEGTFSNIQLQRSSDAKEWITIFESDRAENHLKRSFLDSDPDVVNFYRLIVQELDGTFTYSNLEQVTIDANAQMEISPNPASDFFRISNRPIHARLSIYDKMGRLVHQVNKIGGTNVRIPPALVNGLYTVKIEDVDKGVVQPFKLQITKY